ncbi:unnamed protein product [Clonostachys chloroleuca]|uniref:Xylanolytic transcriptional activator regulatory domain-containing protein n=1 Tax=Clonostachys chloroleuca TaxID=1926264 RepID=A0AA35LPZ9_9HYPO|nr:unnamed protein product [Clonostachys chloroleuca]
MAGSSVSQPQTEASESPASNVPSRSSDQVVYQNDLDGRSPASAPSRTGDDSVAAQEAHQSSPAEGVNGVRNGGQNTGQNTSYVDSEGHSSLSAHSSFAVDFMNKVVSLDQGGNMSSDTHGLLETLSHMVETVQKQHRSPGNCLPSGSVVTVSSEEKHGMPPIEVAVEVIGKAKDCLAILMLVVLMTMRADLLNERSESWPGIGGQDDVATDCTLLCARNIESSLAALPLFVQRSHRMVLALTLTVSSPISHYCYILCMILISWYQAIYSMEISKPSLAWTLIVWAQQTSHQLGFHQRQTGTDIALGAPNHFGLLFWVIYFFEKILSLRLGRSSTIPDVDISIPLPGGEGVPPIPGMRYCQLQVKLARLTGRIYTELYSHQALLFDQETKRRKVNDLSQEAKNIQQEAIANNVSNPGSNLVNRRLLQNIHNRQNKWKDFLDFISASDEVLYLSILTLIHRVSPPTHEFEQSFTEECLLHARAALQRHNEVDISQAPLLLTYMNWTLVFLPFIPFFVLFCHVIQKRDRNDLARLKAFVGSISPASEHSRFASHHRLFKAFYNAAEGYLRPKDSLEPPQQQDSELEQQIETCFSTVGIQASNHADQDLQVAGISSPGQLFPTSLPNGAALQGAGDGFIDGWADGWAPNLNWFAMNQQMMDWIPPSHH